MARAGEGRLKAVLLWTAAFLITLGSAVYQRATGPTYPVSGSAEIAGYTIEYSFERTHGGEGDQEVSVPHPSDLPAGRIQGRLHWKRHGVDEHWRTEPMVITDAPDGGFHLAAYLPHQPPAGKLDFRVTLMLGRPTMTSPSAVSESVLLPADGHVTTRFKGSVPAGVLIPHILLMFLGMLWSTRAGLEALTRGPGLAHQAYLALGMLLVGGMILGPVVQYYAFGAFWTGIPLGWDLTDNKTLIGVAAWVWAVWALRTGRSPRAPVIAASVLTLAVYLVPHSVLGSELDYTA